MIWSLLFTVAANCAMLKNNGKEPAPKPNIFKGKEESLWENYQNFPTSAKFWKNSLPPRASKQQANSGKWEAVRHGFSSKRPPLRLL